ncbi:MAG TPA: DUF4071 domain-containing protein [Zoogloea sp.]|mgnify:CR=1 FL=1|uniref:tetratricopeptide repeat-containing protein n=1 Tax=Zoogloea sp. TaxID=49181 RepID=UPI002C7797B9|nr:tetratricopeptide repeat-containing protein [Zoogloea sp.]HMV18437.1 DUF4071 domain-containing protein [Rhodocyclaceae bacterium]HNF61511.1 DUF4071 domain-containing protein [Rhodocyclaceae bacterium]HNH17177.1 DUF4071 domain-containing protein [Zoogloea sp.]HNI48302.1 DUF4071 domain-containing protein [Zoogloea sp.]
MTPKTCFVIQGFGKKTDYTDGRVLDMDASYGVIKDAVEAAGLVCLRADEIPHSGTIDEPMYRQLLQADLVIADLSTYNVNAAFELGVRYGLRPRATLIVAEEGFKNPFDVSHLVIRRYKHLGEDIGVKEARRFADELKLAIAAILSADQADSPVYTFLPGLQPPALPPPAPRAAPVQAQAEAPTRAGGFDLSKARDWLDGLFHTSAPEPGTDAAADTAGPPTLSRWEPPEVPAPAAPRSAKSLLDEALAALQSGEDTPPDFIRARRLLEAVREQRPNDPFVIQQLVRAISGAARPTPQAALREALALMNELGPATTNDPETLSLWGSIHQRRWELDAQPADLEEAIAGFERGYFVKQDWQTGSALAFLLDRRALEHLKSGASDEAVADGVQARRLRREVLRLAGPHIDHPADDAAKRFSVMCAVWEAHLGLGARSEADMLDARLDALPVPAPLNARRKAHGRTLVAQLDAFTRLRGGAAGST